MLACRMLGSWQDFKQQLECIKMLVTYGTNINRHMRLGRLLRHAISQKSINLVKVLIKNGALTRSLRSCEPLMKLAQSC